MAQFKKYLGTKKAPRKKSEVKGISKQFLSELKTRAIDAFGLSKGQEDQLEIHPLDTIDTFDNTTLTTGVSTSGKWIQAGLATGWQTYIEGLETELTEVVFGFYGFIIANNTKYTTYMRFAEGTGTTTGEVENRLLDPFYFGTIYHEEGEQIVMLDDKETREKLIFDASGTPTGLHLIWEVYCATSGDVKIIPLGWQIEKD